MGASTITARPDGAERIVARAEMRSELHRFALFCRFASVIWLVFAPVSMFMADRVYGSDWTAFVRSRLVGFFVLLAGTQLGKARWINTQLRVGLVTGALAGTTSALIGYEAAYLGGLSSLYVAGPAFPMVALAILQRHWRDVAPPLVFTAAAYFIGLFVALPLPLTELVAAPAIYLVVGQAFLLGLLALFCTILAHVGWQLRRQIYESRSIGRYQLKRRLGQGGMGDVWAAYHRGLEREVAVKILRPEKSDDAARN